MLPGGIQARGITGLESWEGRTGGDTSGQVVSGEALPLAQPYPLLTSRQFNCTLFPGSDPASRPDGRVGRIWW